jgi:hypothetical protein
MSQPRKKSMAIDLLNTVTSRSKVLVFCFGTKSFWGSLVVSHELFREKLIRKWTPNLEFTQVRAHFFWPKLVHSRKNHIIWWSWITTYRSMWIHERFFFFLYTLLFLWSWNKTVIIGGFRKLSPKVKDKTWY